MTHVNKPFSFDFLCSWTGKTPCMASDKMLSTSFVKFLHRTPLIQSKVETSFASQGTLKLPYYTKINWVHNQERQNQAAFDQT